MSCPCRNSGKTQSPRLREMCIIDGEELGSFSFLPSVFRFLHFFLGQEFFIIILIILALLFISALLNHCL